MILSIPFSGLGKCRRQLGSKMLKIPISNPTPWEAVQRMRKGTGSEGKVVSLLKRRGLVVTNAISDQKTLTLPLAKGLQTRGRPDGFLKDVKWAVLEMKLVGKKYFRQWKRNGVAGFRPWYLTQAHAAMAATGIWNSWFEATNSDTIDDEEPEQYTELVEFDLIYWREIVDKWKEVLPYLKKGEAPPPDHDGTTWHCAPESCNWSSLCPAGQFYQNRSGLMIANITGGTNR